MDPIRASQKSLAILARRHTDSKDFIQRKNIQLTLARKNISTKLKGKRANLVLHLPKADPSIPRYTRAPVASIGNAKRDIETEKFLYLQQNRPGPTSYLPSRMRLVQSIAEMNKS